MMSTRAEEKFVGIDVSKEKLDIGVWEGEAWEERYDEEGIKRLVERIEELSPSLIVVEATGGLERGIVVELMAKRLAVAVVNPLRTRKFAFSTGKPAKTDKIDAMMLAHFAQAIRPPVRRLQGEEEAHLAGLITRRRQVIEILSAEKNRLLSTRRELRPRVNEHITWLERSLEALDNEINEHIQSNSDWQEKQEILSSTPGVGPVTSATLIAALPELGTRNRKEIAALAGLAPINRDSGRMRGKRKIGGDRAAVRSVLYMATLSACKYNPIIRQHYESLLQRGKEKKVALVACMRKLLTILNAMILHRELWRTNSVHTIIIQQ
jgi:transposase